MTQQGPGGPFDRIIKPPPGGRKPPTPPRRREPPAQGPAAAQPAQPAPRAERRRPAAQAEPRTGGQARRVRLDSERAPYAVGGAIIFLGLLLWLFFLPPFALFGDDDSSGFDLGSGIRAVPQDKLPNLPEGLQPVSQFYEINGPENVTIDSITIDLNQKTTDGSNLGFYTYTDNEWRRLQRAELVNEGEAVRGTFTGLPGNLAVMRNVNFGFVVAGWLPAGEEVEAEAVSVLTSLNPIDYHPEPSGAVAGIPTNVTNAGQFAIAPTISAESPAEIEALNSIIRSSQLSSTHINNIARLVDEGGYIGIDLDYRRLDPSLGPQFTEFITNLASRLHNRQKTLSLTLPLPTRDRDSWDTGPFNWKQLGESADQIRVPAISDQSIYAARMEDVLKFATAEVPASKLLLTISPYSHVQSEDSITPVPLAHALALGTVATVKEAPSAIAAGSTITLVASNLTRENNASGLRWDEEANVVTFAFQNEGKATTVWLENQYSVAFKLQLVRKHKLGGIAVLDVSSDNLKANIWPSVKSVVEGGALRLLRPNPTLLEPAWEITAPDGSPVPADSLQPKGDGTTTWRIPDTPGLYNATMIVSDGAMRVGQNVRISVSAR